jgi:malonate-semialdehyde dehydrogenase (acetylating)/methylmalonate-semialdehyde dehydrogenase
MSASKNLEYEKTSFLNKSNSAFIERMYLKFVNKDADLPDSWKDYFEGIGDELNIIAKEINGPSWGPKKNTVDIDELQKKIDQEEQNSNGDQAVEVAKKAFETWSLKPPLQRARVMFKFKELIEKNSDELTKLIVSEHGKVYDDAQGSLTRGLEVVEFACGIPHLLKGEFSENVGTNVDSWSMRQPLGVVAGITPFNFPAMVPMWMFPIAIACGNTFILKPSEKDPSCAIKLAELLKEAGLPDGVFNVINGDKESVDAILENKDIKAVSFVGSTPIAKYIYENSAKNEKRVQALGGAKNHLVVMPDCDLDGAVNGLMGAAYGSAGERCMAQSVAVAVGDIGDELVSRLSKKAEALKVGPGMDKTSEMGPLVTKEHLEKVKSYVDLGVEEGAKLVVDGRNLKLQGYENGFYIGGCLFDHVNKDMRIYKEKYLVQFYL